MRQDPEQNEPAPSPLPVIAIVGSTATGKSSLAEALAGQLNGEIVSADSMQVYKGMNIGTAKVPPSKRSTVYHCLDLVVPGQEFSAREYQLAARGALEDIRSRGKQPIVCGGTGLYVRAALDDFALGEPEETAEEMRARINRRERLDAEAERLGPEVFHAKLAALDPESALLIHPHNVRRVVRAFEWLEEGSSYAEQAAGFNDYHSVYPTVFVGLDMPRETLYARINERVERMMEQGLLDEVRVLRDAGLTAAGTAGQAIGYKELLEVLVGTENINNAISRIKQATRRYAKRQQTWFKRDRRIHWLDALMPLEKQVHQALHIVGRKPEQPNSTTHTASKET